MKESYLFGTTAHLCYFCLSLSHHNNPHNKSISVSHFSLEIEGEIMAECCVLITVTHGCPLNPRSDSCLCDNTVLVFTAENSMRSCLFLKEHASMIKEVIRTTFEWFLVGMTPVFMCVTTALPKT